MVSQALRVFSFILIATFLISIEARIPHSVKLHRRFTFISKAAPSNWSKDALEDYDQYHFRFMAIGCQQKKTEPQFFTQCCHPRLKSQTLESIPLQCHLDPQSLITAHDYILKSTNYNGALSTGEGIPVNVKDGSLKLMKPVEGRSSSEPPTPEQLKEMLVAQDKVQRLNDQLKSSTTSTPTSNQPIDPTASKDQNSSSEDQDTKQLDLDQKQTSQHSIDSDESNHHTPSSDLKGLPQVFGQDGDAKGTYFYQEGAAGACGNVNDDSTPLVALPSNMYADGKHCGKHVLIKNTANGKTVVAKVQDMCPGCPSSTSLDLSTGAYDAIGAQATGVLPIQWGFTE